MTRSLTSAPDGGRRALNTGSCIECLRIPFALPMQSGLSLAECLSGYERNARSDAGTVRAVGGNSTRPDPVCQQQRRAMEGKRVLPTGNPIGIRLQATMHHRGACVVGCNYSHGPTRPSDFIRDRCASAFLAGRRSVPVPPNPWPRGAGGRLTCCGRGASGMRDACQTVRVPVPPGRLRTRNRVG